MVGTCEMSNPGGVPRRIQIDTFPTSMQRGNLFAILLNISQDGSMLVPSALKNQHMLPA